MLFRIGDIAFGSALVFLTGALAAGLGWNIFLVSAFLAAVFLLLSLFVLHLSFRTAGLFAAISFFIFLFGAFYFHLFVNWQALAFHLPEDKSPFKVLVVDEPVVSGNYLSFSAKLEPPHAGEIKIFAPPESEAQYGDVVEVSGKLAPPEAPGDAWALFPKNISIVAHNQGFWLVEKLFDFKRSVFAQFSHVLTQDEAALLGGMTLGGTAGMGVALKNEMSASETLYVTSMYGYKMAMIGAFIATALNGRVPRRLRSAIVVIIIFLFVLMSGANISAVRAGIMMAIMLAADLSGNVFSRRNALALTAAGIILGDPTAIIQAGFLFSFASLTGILCLNVPLRRFLRLGEGNGLLEWKAAIILSVASLLPLIPLIGAMFGSFSLTAIIANILISPVVPVAFFCGAALALGGFLSPVISFFIAPLARAMLQYPLFLIHFFAIHAVPLPFQFSGTPSFALYYAILLVFILMYRDEQLVGRNKDNEDESA